MRTLFTLLVRQNGKLVGKRSQLVCFDALKLFRASTLRFLDWEQPAADMRMIPLWNESHDIHDVVREQGDVGRNLDIKEWMLTSFWVSWWRFINPHLFYFFSSPSRRRRPPSAATLSRRRGRSEQFIYSPLGVCVCVSPSFLVPKRSRPPLPYTTARNWMIHERRRRRRRLRSSRSL